MELHNRYILELDKCQPGIATLTFIPACPIDSEAETSVRTRFQEMAVVSCSAEYTSLALQVDTLPAHA